MSNKSNSLDIQPVFMSLEEAEAIIYGQEFFNIKRIYSCAKRNGYIAAKEAERNLNLSTKFHFDLKESLDSELRDHEKEIENLLLGEHQKKEETTGKIFANSFYSRPGSPSILEKMSSTKDLRSLPASPVFGRRSISLTPEPTAYASHDEHYNTIQTLNWNTINARKRLPNLPLRSSPLYRSTNICLTNPNQSENRVASRFLYPPHEPIKHDGHLQPPSPYLQQPNGRGKLLNSKMSPYHSNNVDAFKKPRNFNGHISNSRRFTKQLTLPESWGLDSSIEEECGENSSTLETFNNQHTIPRMERDKPLHYYVIGRTKYT